MPTTPKRTKKALQEIARVFNKLASELTADLNEAIKEIETLRHEVRALKTNRTGSTKTTRTNKNSGNKRKTTTGTTHTGTTSNTGHHTTHPSTSNPTDSSYVFPQEPFTPIPPPEPSAPGNN
jgi:hypothetical protein